MNKRGKIICIDGIDSTGKETQSKLLYETLKAQGEKVMLVSFPNYNSKSSVLVKMYLYGELGDNPNDTNPYIASQFFAVDRYASYKTEWEQKYKEGYTIIFDRYVTSNLIHQSVKLNGAEKDLYLDWVTDLEYNKNGLPKPDLVFILEVEHNIANDLMKNRANKIPGQAKKDIHEANEEYMKECFLNQCYVANKYNWKRISCTSDNKMLSKEDIHTKIVNECMKINY